MKKNQKSTQFKAREDRNVVQWSPLESTGDGSLIITERKYLVSLIHRITSNVFKISDG